MMMLKIDDDLSVTTPKKLVFLWVSGWSDWETNHNQMVVTPLGLFHWYITREWEK